MGASSVDLLLLALSVRHLICDKGRVRLWRNIRT